MRFFYVIYVKNEILRTLIDGIRLFADVSQKYSAHITVRGPYEGDEYYVPDRFADWQNEILNTHIKVSGVDTFFNVNQSTVYFKCESEELEGIWWKKHFTHYSPHMTIYDRSDKEFASELLDELDKYNFNFSFGVHSLDKLISDSKRYPKIQGKLFGPLIDSINYEMLSIVLEDSIDRKFIETSDRRQRIQCIRFLSEKLSNIRSDTDL